MHFQHLFTAKRARRRSLGAGSAQEFIRHNADHQDRHADAITQFPTPKTLRLMPNSPRRRSMAFLSSHDASYITGAELAVDGGRTQP